MAGLQPLLSAALLQAKDVVDEWRGIVDHYFRLHASEPTEANRMKWVCSIAYLEIAEARLDALRTTRNRQDREYNRYD